MNQPGVQTVLRRANRSVSESDRDLLRRFAAMRDEPAFAELVRRHGPMVLGVCRRALGDHHDAEEAFQATFLALANRADASWPDSVAGWLHAVAMRIASKVRRGRSRRFRRERTAAKPECQPATPDLFALLDEEVHRLGTAHREPILLCYFQGHTRDQAATELGCSLRTLERRLTEARAMLKKRLSRGGVTLGSALLAAELATASVIPASLAGSAMKAALGGASGPVIRLATLGGNPVTPWKWLPLIGVVLTLGTGMALALRQTDEPPPRSEEAETAEAEPGSRVLGDQRFRFAPYISSIAYSPDGKLIATAGLAWGVCVWDADTGELRYHRTDHELEGECQVAFSPDGETLVLAHADKSQLVLAFEAKTGRPRWRLDGCGSPVSFSADGELLAVVQPGRIDARRARTDPGSIPPTVVQLLRGTDGGYVSDMASDDGDVLLTFAPKHRRVVWQYSNRQIKLAGHTNSGRLINHMQMPGNVNHQDIVFSPNGDRFATCDDEGRLKFWNAETGAPLGWASVVGVQFRTVRYHPDGNRVAVGTDKGEVRIHDTDGRLLRTWKAHDGGNVEVAFSPDGERLATGSSQEAVLRFWNPDTGEAIRDAVDESSGYAADVAVADDGSVLTYGRPFSANIVGSLQLWERNADKAEGLPLPEMEAESFQVILSPTGRQYAFLAYRKTSPMPSNLRVGTCYTEAHLRDRDGNLLRLEGMDRPLWPFGAAFSADGERLIAICYAMKGSSIERPMVCWDTASGKVVSEAYPMRSGQFGQTAVPMPMAVSSDGTRVAIVSDRLAIVWDVAADELLWNIPTPGESQIALSPDGKTVAVTLPDGPTTSLALFDVATGAKRSFGEIPSGGKESLEFSPDGRLLASGTANGPVRLWDTETGKLLCEVTDLRGGAYSLAFSADGRTLAIGEGAGTVRLVPVGSESE